MMLIIVLEVLFALCSVASGAKVNCNSSKTRNPLNVDGRAVYTLNPKGKSLGVECNAYFWINRGDDGIIDYDGLVSLDSPPKRSYDTSYRHQEAKREFLDRVCPTVFTNPKISDPSTGDCPAKWEKVKGQPFYELRLRFYQKDEFPFGSTYGGGLRDKNGDLRPEKDVASILAIPARENGSDGGSFGALMESVRRHVCCNREDYQNKYIGVFDREQCEHYIKTGESRPKKESRNVIKNKFMDNFMDDFPVTIKLSDNFNPKSCRRYVEINRDPTKVKAIHPNHGLYKDVVPNMSENKFQDECRKNYQNQIYKSNGCLDKNGRKKTTAMSDQEAKKRKAMTGKGKERANYIKRPRVNLNKKLENLSIGCSKRS